MTTNTPTATGLERAIALAGNQSELARRIGCGVRQQHVHWWLRNGVPPVRAIQIEQALNGAVTRSELRPDLWPPEE